MKMNKKIIPYLILTVILLLGSCTLTDREGYDDFAMRQSIGSILNSSIMNFTKDTTLYFCLMPAAGALIFFLGLILFLLHSRDKSNLFLSVSALFAGVLYTLPFWSDLIPLPSEFWSLTMVRTLTLIIYWQLYREWARRALYHRTKNWTYIVNSVLLSAVLICTLLSGHYPVLIAGGWPVAVMGILLFTDSLINSLLSFQRKSDRSGIAGVLTVLPPALCGVWLYFSIGYNGFLAFSSELFFILPAFMLPWQLILGLSLSQRRFSRQIDRSSVLSSMIDEEEKQKEKLEELISALEKRNEEESRIPDYSLECARLLMGEQNESQLNTPEAWEGSQRLSTLSSNWPVMGAWYHRGSLLFAENMGPEPLTPLLYISRCFHSLGGTKPALLPQNLNDRMISLSQTMETGLSGSYLHFMEDEVLCGTAGTIRIYLQKGDTVLPIRSDAKPATFVGGFGVRAQTREDGKPFRLKVENGDKLILVSVSLTDREKASSGETYGQKSLYRVLKNRTSSTAEETLQAIVKDFEDFDMGNTEDRQFYAAVFRKL